MSKKNHYAGKAGQDLAIKVLRSRGVRMAEQIGTPVRLIPVIGQKGAYRVYFGDKVSGDISGLLDDGTRVIAEVKSVRGEKLSWSKLRAHQPERLDLNKNYNGVSLLVWVSDYGVFVMDWIFPNEDFKKGTPMTAEKARELDMMDVWTWHKSIHRLERRNR